MSMTNEELLTKVAVFKALGHPARLTMVAALTEGEQCVCELQRLVGIRYFYGLQTPGGSQTGRGGARSQGRTLGLLSSAYSLCEATPRLLYRVTQQGRG